MPPAVGILIVFLFLLALAPAPASATTKLPRAAQNHWRGKIPPDAMLPRPLYGPGDVLIDNSGGYDRTVTVAYLEGAKYAGGYVWTYNFNDGTGAQAGTLRRK